MTGKGGFTVNMSLQLPFHQIPGGEAEHEEQSYT